MCRPNIKFYETEKLVYFESGNHDCMSHVYIFPSWAESTRRFSIENLLTTPILYLTLSLSSFEFA